MSERNGESKFDVAVYSENRNAIPWEELQPYAGQWVAFSSDGKSIVTNGPDIETVEANLKLLGIPGNEVGLDRIPGLDEDCWL